MEELKPCPFCGSEGEVHEPEEVISGGHNWYVDCSNNDCIAHQIPDGEFNYVSRSYENKQEAIEVWNTRISDKE